MEDLDNPERTDNAPKRRTLQLLLLSAGAIAAGYTVSRLVSPSVPDVGSIEGLLWPARAIQTFRLDSTDGGDLDIAALQGTWTFLFFGFTTCPDVCPTTLNVMASLRTKVESLGLNQSIQMIFVSVDPARDSIELLKSYVGHFDPSFKGATGTIEELNVLTEQLGVLHIRDEPDESGSYHVDHSASVLLLDPEVRRVGIFSTPHVADDMLQRFQSILQFVELQS